MSLPNLTNNNLIQSQNIVINQMPITHTIMTNVNSNNGGIPIVSSTPHSMSAPQPQSIDSINNEIKTGLQTMNVQSNTIKSQLTGAGNASGSTDNYQVLTKQRLQDLVRETDSTLSLEEDIEEIVLGYVDEFVDRCLNGAALIAKNRHGQTVEVKDLQQFLNRNYHMWTPGFGTDELRPYKRSLTTDAHKQRLALIRKSLKKY